MVCLAAFTFVSATVPVEQPVVQIFMPCPHGERSDALDELMERAGRC